ncbi:MAG: type II secretion system F family protein [Candidatus Thermoplasmatota archaeon]|nr:type II secretion system F family protein [Candidatus Thermoplasmatota archaeon]
MSTLPEVSDVFERVETKKGEYLKTKLTQRGEDIGPHGVRLTKGAVPDYVSLTKFQDLSWRIMGKFASDKMTSANNQALEESLTKAHMRIRVEEYYAYVLMSTIIAFAIGVVIAVVVGIILFGVLGVSIIVRIMISGIAIGLLPMMAFMMLMGSPASKAKSRGRDIDKRIAAAMSFISAMASADVNIDVIFKELSRQKVYGEISAESSWITRDTELLGSDILTAIKKASKRSPSAKFQEFLQGVVTTSTSGGQLKPYFLLKADEYQKENKLAMKSQMETLGMLAESFVTVVVAFPLFLVLIMAIMAIVGGGDSNMMVTLLYLIVLGMIPISQFGFIFVIWNMSQEGAM